MAGRLLYFRGTGIRRMEGVKEYVMILHEDDDTPVEECTAPGFVLHSELKIEGDVTPLPTDRTLIPLDGI